MPELSIFKPVPLFKSQLPRGSTVFAWISEVRGLEEFLGVLDGTVVNCTQRIDVGAYSHHNRSAVGLPQLIVLVVVVVATGEGGAPGY